MRQERGHRSSASKLLLILLGAAFVVSLLAADPAVLGLLLDADFLALSAAVGLAFLRHDGELLGTPGCREPAGAVVPGRGVRLTREQPRSLLA